MTEKVILRSLLCASTKAIYIARLYNNHLSANKSSDWIPKTTADHVIPKVGEVILGPGDLGDQISHLGHWCVVIHNTPSLHTLMRNRVLTLSLTDLAELVLNQAYRIAGNFAGAKFCGNASRLFTVCIFVEWMHYTLITPPPVVAHTPHIQTKETILNKEAKKQACTTMA